jgi:hypothetical protein
VISSKVKIIKAHHGPTKKVNENLNMLCGFTKQVSKDMFLLITRLSKPY